MSTAVLISGQMRTFAKCYPTQRWQIFRHYEPDIHFFVSCVDDEQAKSAELLREHYENVHIERYQDPDLPEIHMQFGAHAPYANATSHKKLMLQHWGNQKVWDFFMSQPGKDWKCVIRIRPDLWIHRFEKPRPVGESEAFCPWWGKFGGVNDRLAVLGFKQAAWSYFNVYSYIQSMLNEGCPFHPETLVAERLRGSYIHPLMTSFSTMRMDGSQRWPEIIMDDIAELINGKA